MSAQRRASVLLVAAGLTLAGCTDSASSSQGAASSTSAAESGELTGTLTVFAAASLTDVFTELGDRLMTENPDLDIRFNFAGSSALAMQITQGAAADVFASADETQMGKVTDAGLAVDPEVFATNGLMLVVPADNPLGIRLPEGGGIPSLTEILDHDVTMAVCAPEVPCGAASETLLENAGIQVAPASSEQSVTAVLTKVSAGEADAGLVYATAVRDRTDVDSFAPDGASAVVNRYPIAALTSAANPEAAAAFAEFVVGADGQALLAGLGFGPP